MGADVTQEGSAAARYLETLDVRFAGLFFSALDSYGRDPAQTPSGWFRCSPSVRDEGSRPSSSRLRG